MDSNTDVEDLYSDEEIMSLVGVPKTKTRDVSKTKKEELEPPVQTRSEQCDIADAPLILVPHGVDMQDVINELSRPSVTVTNTDDECRPSSSRRNVIESEDSDCDDPHDPTVHLQDLHDSESESGGPNETAEHTLGLQVQITDNEDANIQNTRVRRSKKRGEPKEWKKQKNKKLRMAGQAFLGFSKPAGQKLKHDTQREARTMKPTCSSRACQKSKLRFCSEFSEEIRNEIFNKFWQDLTWDQRKIYVCSHVDKSATMKRTVPVNEDKQSRRQGSYSYSLHLGNEKKVVCKTMFMNTLCLGEWAVHNWASGTHGLVASSEAVNESRAGLRPNLDTGAKRRFAGEFFDSLAKVPSHYCRKDTMKLYLEPDMFKSKTAIFKEYKRVCEEANVQCLSSYTFYDIMVDKNIELFAPKKDLCDICCQHDVGNLNDAEWELHQKKKNRARDEKSADKMKAANSECFVFTVDLQAVKLSPCLPASALYYKTKLCVHNFTVFNLNSKHVTNFMWHEGESELVASSFASCVIDYLTEYHENSLLPIIIFSDGCTYQNRNAILANALLHFSVRNNVVITQKYLEKGHTQMECDSVHATIESRLKNRNIYLPTDYVSVSDEARLPSEKYGPYKTKYLKFDFFKDYSSKETMRYDSIRPGKVVNDPTVTDLRAIRYSPDGRIHVKLDFDGQWADLPRRPKTVPDNVVFKPLYTEQLPIPARKWEHLQQLKSVLPAWTHSFYDDLPKA